ncbi:MAG: MFS transporter [Oceanobacter sp.]
MTFSPASQPSHPAKTGLIAITLLFVAINLRPVIASVGPLVEEIHTATGMESLGIGWLSTLPLLLMGLAAFTARPLRKMVGEYRGIGIGMALILIACLARGLLANSHILYISAGLAGIGIAMTQALAPGYIKAQFKESASRMIGLYSSSIVAGAAIAAGVSADVSALTGWANALAIWAIPTGIALVLWLITARPVEATATNTTNTIEDIAFYKDSRSWSLLVFFGIGTSAFMLILAWLPPYFMDLGLSPEHSGYLAAGFTLTELLTALLISTFINRFPDRRGLLLLSIVLSAVGLLMLTFLPLAAPPLTVILLGIGIGIHFPLSLIVTAEHCENPVQTGELMAFVQGGGYAIAALAPLATGLFRDAAGSIAPAWLLMAILTGLLVIIAGRYSPASYVLFRKRVTS